MGIGDWFKRFKRNAAALEEYREGVAQEPVRRGSTHPSRASAPPPPTRTAAEAARSRAPKADARPGRQAQQVAAVTTSRRGGRAIVTSPSS